MISAGTLAPRCSRRSSWRRNDCVFEETNNISLKKPMMKMKMAMVLEMLMGDERKFDEK